ncbi:valyl-tRNA synthetase [Paecilomyces variotii No. 5]|uniref:Valyl-tRNA synthetase n=1 Tax=Byssochlamys spectabilis (strain No. 5 / NBRC 109023) TaxID=1356009 RepID=V5FBP1_BYSSN|nr:valyl-tRNA synthetase [Paecilomyces variotii No. 5]
MSQTSASQNPLGQPTAPLTERPPSANEETKREVLQAAKKDPEGQHLGGQDTSEPPKMKLGKKEQNVP